MSSPEEDDATRQHRLVRKAIQSGMTGCFEWDNDKLQNRVRAEPEFDGLQPHELKRLAIEHVRSGGLITQRKEADEEWLNQREFDFWYSICFEVAGLANPVFMKIVLLNDEEEYPESRIVGVHPSRS
jgi:hypothetical protein